MQKAVLAITTYNRRANLESLISSFRETRDKTLTWDMIIADDGSTDTTAEYLDRLQIDDVNIILIRNNRRGVHHQFNTIVRQLEKMSFDICFKCDDDILFKRAGWEALYIDAIEESGYHHLCYFSPNWRPEKNLRRPILQGKLESHCAGKDVQGAFFTLTMRVIKEVGYMDVENFGFRGVGHIDYTLRACRTGFNHIEHPFDAAGSNHFISLQDDNYRSALPQELIYGLENESEIAEKYKLIQSFRTFVPYNESNRSMDKQMENDYLMRAVRSLERQKEWYEEEIARLKNWEKEAYGHLPQWYLRLGRIFKLIQK